MENDNVVSLFFALSWEEENTYQTVPQLPKNYTSQELQLFNIKTNFSPAIWKDCLWLAV